MSKAGKVIKLECSCPEYIREIFPDEIDEVSLSIGDSDPLVYQLVLCSFCRKPRPGGEKDEKV